MTIYEVIVLLVIGLLGGFVAGSLGVGGGIIIVPSLIFLLGMTQHQAQGTSLAMMLAPIGILAAINYHREGHINIGYAIILMIVFIVGGYFGSMFAIKLPATALKKIFGVLMLIVGFRMIFWP
jgi:uncharacterized membrane protein YfcA